ncbi:Uncharacterised protein [Escherichia coli]|nr:Uncharacterised protein [Escherichia coli]
MNTQNTQPKIMNYDPNLTLYGRMAKQTVRLTSGYGNTAKHSKSLSAAI